MQVFVQPFFFFQVKDALRDGDILLLAEAWAHIITDFSNHNGNLLSTQSCEDLVSRCLKILARYVAWIDVQIIANEKFLSHAFSLFNRNSGSGPAVMDLLGAVRFSLPFRLDVRGMPVVSYSNAHQCSLFFFLAVNP